MLETVYGVCCAVLAVVVGMAAGFATGRHGASHPGLSRWEQPGGSAIVVGFATALLVITTGSAAFAVYKWRRNPNVTFSTKYERRLTTAQYLRRMIVMAVILVAIVCLGLWLRHKYG